MIFIFGDVHGDFDHVLPAVREYRPAAVIFLGDLQAKNPLERELESVAGLTEVWWIHGNHDTDSQADYGNLFESALAGRNLHGRVEEIDGLRIAGLGGVFRESIWYPRVSVDAEPVFESYQSFVEKMMEAERWEGFRRLHKDAPEVDSYPSPPMKGKALTHKSTIFRDVWLGMYVQQADILVTHEAPSCHPHGFFAIDELARSMQVKASFHGHHHDCLGYQESWDALGFRAYGVGLRGITDVHGNRVRAGELDARRSYRQGLLGK